MTRGSLLLLIALVLCGQGASAQEAPSIPRPVARPQASTPPPADAAAPDRAAPPDTTAPEPAPAIRDTLAETPNALKACLADLKARGTVFSRPAPLTEPDDRDCGIVNPVSVTAFGDVTIGGAAPMRCDLAAGLAGWLAAFVQPAAARLGHGPVTALAPGSTYDCRRRNNRPDGLLSEHAFGNAFDIMSFTFQDGTSLPVLPRQDEGDLEEAFQRAVRGAACLDFTTVLGPGSDPSHAEHLHLDIRDRKGGYRLCQ
ncbi:MAG: extensin family protein [Alphaproteobacteria bacterium]|nr:extensin family protein [Alphaproteobacteria bacterium]